MIIFKKLAGEGTALDSPPKPTRARVLGLIIALLVISSPARAEQQSHLCLTPSSCLPALSSVALIEPQPTADPPQQAAQQSVGSITGTVVDPTGTPVPGTTIKLTRPGQSAGLVTVSDDGGNFYFLNVLAGDFMLTISAPDFAKQDVPGTLKAAEYHVIPRIVLALATVTTVVQVEPQEVVAERQIKAQEKQRVLGIIPNFYVSYVPSAAPLTARQKFELAWKSSTDITTIGGIGAQAGLEQAKNWYPSYGQGAQGYGKRFGAAYADATAGTFIGNGIFATLFKQDPRYFYKGSGSFRSRLVYALTRSLIAKGDNGRWQPNYSNVLGNLSAGALANAYYPQRNRGWGFAFQAGGIRIAETAVANIFEELISKKLTPGVSRLSRHNRRR